MKKKHLLLLSILTLVSAFITFYAVNLLMSDLANYQTSTYLLSSIPFAMLSTILISMCLYLVRVNKHNDLVKTVTRRYLIIDLVFAVIGLATSIITGTSVYKSFIEPYPFNGYAIIMIIVFVAFIALSIIALIKCVPKLQDTGKKNFKFFNVLKNIVYNFLLIICLGYAFNKFGAFLWIPVYASFRTLDLTFLYFISLTTPMFFLVISALNSLKLINKKTLLTLSLVLIGVVILTHGYTIIYGMYNSDFLSWISPTVPIDRLGTGLYDILIRSGAMLFSSLSLLIYSVVKYNK